MTEEKKMNIYYPGKNFPAISITGHRCKLGCGHCGGHYLKSMLAATEPELLYDTCKRLNDDGAKGVLISGGCDQSGQLDLERFYETIARIKKDTGLVINIHTGLIGENVAKQMADAGVDVVSFDLVGEQEVLKNVYGINRQPDEYKHALSTLLKKGLEVVPHICIGLNPGSIEGELKSVEMLKDLGISKLIFIIFIPTKGTRMENEEPPSTDQVREVLMYATKHLPGTEILLGCMRPRRPERYEFTAIEAGVSGIVLPSNETIKALEDDGWDLIRKEQCCAI